MHVATHHLYTLKTMPHSFLNAKRTCPTPSNHYLMYMLQLIIFHFFHGSKIHTLPYTYHPQHAPHAQLRLHLSPKVSQATF